MFDYAIRNGTIVDGTCQKPYRAAVYIQDGKIASISRDNDAPAAMELDAAGKIVSPGFIDMHSHSDIDSFPDEKRESKLFQGVTLEVTGSCGYSAFPFGDKNREETLKLYSIRPELQTVNTFADFKKTVERYGYPTHLKCQVGHGTLRGFVMGLEKRPPTAREMERMKQVLDDELKAGAAGLSLGLIYPPGSFCETEELIELAKVVQANGKFLSVHMRSEGERIFRALEEMLLVARETGVQLQISHLKLMGTGMWGRAEELLQRLEEARSQGISVTCDQYPFTATSTKLGAILPDWAHDGGTARMLDRLRDRPSGLMEAAAAAIENRGGAEGVVISATYGKAPSCDGKSLRELAREQAATPVEAAFQLLIRTEGKAVCVYHCISPEDMKQIMRDRQIAVGSDGSAVTYDRSVRAAAHPRFYGTFPRFLQTVRENDLMPLEDAVYKMTGLSAGILKIPDRGVLREGNRADITIFDYPRVRDMCTYANPVARPEGIEAVFVEGVLAARGDMLLNGACGRVL